MVKNTYSKNVNQESYYNITFPFSNNQFNYPDNNLVDDFLNIIEDDILKYLPIQLEIKSQSYIEAISLVRGKYHQIIYNIQNLLIDIQVNDVKYKNGKTAMWYHQIMIRDWLKNINSIQKLYNVIERILILYNREGYNLIKIYYNSINP